MYFAQWLLKRINKHLFNNWEWVRKYRRFIIEEKPISILLTILCGLLWFMICGILTIWLVDDKQLGSDIMKGVIVSVPLFFIYNWLMALYEIFDTERMASWEYLKNKDL